MNSHFFTVTILCVLFFSTNSISGNRSFELIQMNDTIVSGHTSAAIDTTDTANTEKEIATSSFEVIDKSYYPEILQWLLPHETFSPPAITLAMGFETDLSYPQKIYLAVISLNSRNQPQKQLFPVDHTFYSTYSENKMSIGTVSTSPELIKAQGVHFDHSQDGRLYFMLNTSARSLGIYTTAFSAIFESIDERVIIGLSLLSLGSSLYGSYAFSKTLPLGYGRVEFMNYGADMGGICYPLLFQFAFNPDIDDEPPLIMSYSAIVGFPLGIYLGSKLTFADNTAYGNASMMTNLSRSGPLYGFLLPMIGIPGDDILYKPISSFLSSGFVPLGFYIGKKLVGDRTISSGRSIMTTSAGILGALTGLTFPILFESENEHVTAALVLAGHAAGTAFGFRYKHDNSYTYAQGIFTAASALIGTGVGLSIPLIGKTENNKAYVAAGITGCWSGYVVGEKLSRELFDMLRENDHHRVSLSFPGLFTLPALLLSSKHDNHRTVPKNPSLKEYRREAPLVRVTF